MQSLPIVNTIPTPGTTPEQAGALEVAFLDKSNALEILGKATAGSGSLKLLRWFPDLEEWRPWREDRPVFVDSSAYGGFFSASYIMPTGGEAFLLYDSSGTITATAYARARSGMSGDLEPRPSAASPLAVDVLLGQVALPVNVGSSIDRQSSGAVTSTQTVAVNTAACGSVAIQVTGTWTGTLYFEKFISTWTAVEADPQGDTSTTANGNWTIACAGFQQVRVRGAVASGSASVALNASTATSTVVLGEALPAGMNAIGTVGVTSSALPSGAATSAKQDTGNTSLSSIDSRVSSLSTETTLSAAKALLGAGLPAALVSGRLDVNIGASAATIPVSGTFWQTTQPVSGTVSVSNSFALDATLTGGTQRSKLTDGTNNAALSGSAPTGTEQALVVRNIPSGTQPVSGTVAVSNSFALDSTLAKLAISQGASLGTNTQALVGGSVTTSSPTYTTGQISPLSLTTSGALRVDEAAGSTGAPTKAAITGSNQTLWSSRAGRIGGYIFNDSTTTLYVKLGATATTDDYSFQVLGGKCWEMPRRYYTGQVDVIGGSATGNVRHSEVY